MCALGKSNSTLKETHEEHGCVQEDNETKEMSNSSTTLQKRNRRYIITEETLANCFMKTVGVGEEESCRLQRLPTSFKLTNFI